MRPHRIVIVGAGLAGWRTAQALRADGYDGHLTLIGDENRPPYDRPPLSKKVLAGKWTSERTSLTDGSEAADLGIQLLLGRSVRSVDEAAVLLDTGGRVPYDTLVIASGVRARTLPEQPVAPRVHTLRTLDDCLALRDTLEHSCSLLVIGGGFIGAEVAATACGHGLGVTIVEALEYPFAAVLGRRVGSTLADLHAAHGVTVHSGAPIARFVGNSLHSVVVELADGRRLEGDCAVVGIGTIANTGWLPSALTTTSGGVLCDAGGRVLGAGDGRVFAVGDVAAWPEPITGHAVRFEHWTRATEQANIAAASMLGHTPKQSPLPYFWSDQYGRKIQLLGRPELADAVAPATQLERGAAWAYTRQGHLVAALTVNQPRLLARSRPFVAQGADLGDLEQVYTVREDLSRNGAPG